MKRIIWLSDLHLDQVGEDQRQKFYHRLSKAHGETVVVTGDISDGRHLSKHLLELGEACDKRPLYFVLGNHDFYGSSFDQVHREVNFLCKKQKNLRHLGHGEIIPIGQNQALVGHDGWADGRAGHGSESKVINPDFWSIDEFRRRKWQECFDLMNELGRKSENYFKHLLPLALEKHKYVCLATHVPPFTQSARWNGKVCNYDYQPHYTNVSLGFSLWGMSKVFSKSTLTVLSGHTHSKVSLSLRHNLCVHTADATCGDPRYQRLPYS